jgi:tyrosine-protein phosphatase SIW14
MNRYIIFLILFGLCHSDAFAELRVRPAHWAAPVIGTKLENVFKVDSDIFRSEQPDNKVFTELSKFGLREVLSLRKYNSDKRNARRTDLTLHRLKLSAGEVSEDDLIAALAIIQKRQGPLLIHCWHGADRTGAVVAAYRIVFNQWSKEEALDEMVNGGHGYHATFYPNLVQLIQDLDVEKIRKALGIAADPNRDVLNNPSY